MTIQVANRLIELRKRKGLSQEELADVLGVSRQAVSKWERTEASPDTDNLIALAKFYNISLDELLDTNTPVDEVLKDENPKEENKENNAENTADSVHIDIKGVHIDNKGVRIEDEDGSYVHIDKEGIHLKDDDEEREVLKARKIAPEIKEYKPSLIESIITSSFLLAVTTAYVVLGACLSNVQFGPSLVNSWGFFWFMFIFVPVPSSIIKAIRYRRMNKVNITCLVTSIYCFLGMLLGLWHPLWCLFFLIPLYHSIATAVDKHNKN